jgi:hypothetical protein
MALLVTSRVYTVSQVITNPGAVTNLNIQAPSTRPLVVVRARITLAQATIPAAANARIRLQQFTAAPTVTSIASSAFFNHDGVNSTDSSATAGHTATVAGTETDFIEEGWGSATGWTFDFSPTPEEYIFIGAGTGNGFGLKSNVAPPAGNYAFNITFHEII